MDWKEYILKNIYEIHWLAARMTEAAAQSEAARDAMKAVCPHLKVGLTLSLHHIQAQPGGEENTAKEWDEEYEHYLPYIKKDDFFGLQNYTRSMIRSDGRLQVVIRPAVFRDNDISLQM